ncbi:MAG: hypothetical protein D8M57_16875 [Candidatus Scalindua sp. AMX11]|nr:MAG: hypothetical protein DWQ00_12610 [Candidatus Scalindua sp.]NOG85148.1 hypothetical protein [Planctomycetota bacterium]RZV67647.1 MAG: hypothetical protein EX341_16855 [Candidatus Scalindua sp. SCAELEC01]TDE63700.1 MAG: hypothetical protein D8M57_16875 [Candidatus Scalindua sp. AMX11]GJQ57221.1 MAG: hypothetical protein SCALA701_00220 [Candidatus Scalindua sp.]
MKTILTLIIISFALSSTSFADDISATAIDGRDVILHDNGTWEFTNLEEPAELSGPEQAEECVKNHPSSREGTVDYYLTKKIENKSVEDLGWQVSPVEDGFEVERLLLVSKKMKSKYRWHVNKTGKVTPLNIKASGITE